MDYLAPFLAQLGHPKSFTKEDVAKLTRDCLEGTVVCKNIEKISLNSRLQTESH